MRPVAVAGPGAQLNKNIPRALYRAEQVRALDRLALAEIAEPGVSGFALMRRAGAAAFSCQRQRWPEARSILVFTGSGNNGGDGFVIAALAAAAGLRVQIVCLSPPDELAGAAATARDMAAARQVETHSFKDFKAGAEAGASRHFDLIVDSIFGTGLNRPPAGDSREAIEWINTSHLPVLAVDVPSGLHADSGTPLGAAVRAELTVVFIGMKRGLLTHQGPDCTGDVVFADLDAPARVYRGKHSPAAETRAIDIHSTAGLLPRRRPSAHKGSNGHVVLLGGDHGMGGAIMLAAEAALRSGAGLVSVATRSAHRSALLARRPEIMVTGTEDERVDLPGLFDRASNIVIGPGLGRGDWSRNLLRAALAAQSSRELPLVVDADALRLLAEGEGPEAHALHNHRVLTPHPGEAAAMLGTSVGEVQRDRFAAVAEIQQRFGGHCLLKGAGSLICGPERPQRFKLCTEGNPGMAGAGMGDVLSGIIAGLNAQGLSLGDALHCAVCVHGEAGDLAALDGGERGLIATDLLPFIRRLVNPRQATHEKSAHSRTKLTRATGDSEQDGAIQRTAGQ